MIVTFLFTITVKFEFSVCVVGAYILSLMQAIELDASTSDIKIHSDRQLVPKNIYILEAKNLLKWSLNIWKQLFLPNNLVIDLYQSFFL